MSCSSFAQPLSSPLYTWRMAPTANDRSTHGCRDRITSRSFAAQRFSRDPSTSLDASGAFDIIRPKNPPRFWPWHLDVKICKIQNRWVGTSLRQPRARHGLKNGPHWATPWSAVRPSCRWAGACWELMAETFGVLVRFGPRSPQKKAPEKISEEMPGASLVLFRSSCPNSKPHNLTLETRSRKAPSRRKGQFSTGMPAYLALPGNPFFYIFLPLKIIVVSCQTFHLGTREFFQMAMGQNPASVRS